MPAQVPNETADLIIDLLHDDRKALRKCCLISESWIPRARKHLFNKVKLVPSTRFKDWKNAFPDPQKSPAHHTSSLFIPCTRDAEDDAWIKSFTAVTRLEVLSCNHLEEPQLEALHELLPAVKSLRLALNTAPLSKVFNLICSFPFLEDLDIVVGRFIDDMNKDGGIPQPPTPPLCTATRLVLQCELEGITSQFLGLPDKPHFEEIVWKPHSPGKQLELPWVMALIEKCPETLEWIDFFFNPDEPSPATLIDFSKARKLKGVTFHELNELNAIWVVESLKKIKCENEFFEQISICTPQMKPFSPDAAQEIPPLNCEALDKILVQLWELRKIRTKVVCDIGRLEEGMAFIRSGLPEILEEGGIEIISG